MAQTNVNIRIDEMDKRLFDEICGQLGLPLRPWPGYRSGSAPGSGGPGLRPGPGGTDRPDHTHADGGGDGGIQTKVVVHIVS